MKAAIVVMLVARIASAAPDSDAALFAEGQRQYQAGAYDAAAALFVRAYSIQPDPAYLFNAAQAFRNANDCKAHEYYTKFLAAMPAAPNAAEIRGHLAVIAPCAKKSEPPKPETRELPPPRPSPHDPGRPRRLAGIVTIGVGAIALAGGAIFTARVGARERDANELCPDTCEWTPAKTIELADIDRRASRDRTLAIAGFAAGGVAIAGGIVLYMLGRTAHTGEGIAVVPTTDGVMATIARKF